MQDIAALRARLLESVRPDGGWAYYAGKAGRAEPTAWALLALGATGLDTAVRDGAVRFLSNLRREADLLIDPGAPGPNFAWNGLALIALQGVPTPAAADLANRLAGGLMAVRGAALRPDSAIQQDNALQAWSWTDGTFSWVEPTAYCLLALKRLPGRSQIVADRIAEADALLFDRACQPAGWNYGNSAVLGQDLRPYVPTTALALLALQDRRAEPAAGRALEWLVEHAATESSAMALSLAAICLAVHGQSADKPVAGLVGAGRQTAFLENAHLQAMALFASTLSEHGGRAFRL